MARTLHGHGFGPGSPRPSIARLQAARPGGRARAPRGSSGRRHRRRQPRERKSEALTHHLPYDLKRCATGPTNSGLILDRSGPADAADFKTWTGATRFVMLLRAHAIFA